MKKNLLFIVSILFCQLAYAQYYLKENNIWAFGEYAGIDFNGASPVAIKTAMFYIEGSASICDANGNLLFYTEGDTVWTSNHHAMPNGRGLRSPFNTPPNSEAVNSALIIPVIDNPNQYYIFSLEDGFVKHNLGDRAASRFCYSIVDMTISWKWDNSTEEYGDIVPGKKGIYIDSMLGENMVAIPGDDCNIWIVLHSVDKNQFKAFEITSAGVSPTPVISTAGQAFPGIDLAYALGDMKVSPDRKKIAVCSPFGLSYGQGFPSPDLSASGVAIFDFDSKTGEVSNGITIDTFSNAISACFSPDGKRLYASTNVMAGLTPGATESFSLLSQFDVSLTSPQQIIASRNVIDTASAEFGYLRLGPDGKIYVAQNNSNRVGRINSPNLSGPSCEFTDSAVVLIEGTQVFKGLPAEYVKPLQDTITETIDTFFTQTHPLDISVPQGSFEWKWGDNSADSLRTITEPGRYTLTYSNYCEQRTEIFNVRDATSINNVSETANAVVIFPNPARNTIVVAMDGKLHKGQLVIYDAMGRSVMSMPFEHNNEQYDISNLANGVYTVHLISSAADNARYKARIIVMK